MKNLLALSLLVLLFSCRQDLPNEPENIVIDIPIDFNIVMWETLSEEERNLSFLVETTKSSYCEESFIAYNLDSANDIVKFSLNSIEPEFCDGEHSADSNIEIGELEDKAYNLQINLKEEIINVGTLDVSASRYTIKNMDNPVGFRLTESVLERVPENTLWGYLTYEDSQTASDVNAFFTALNTIVTDRAYSDGNYGHFKIKDGHDISFDYDISGKHVETFIFQYEGTDTTIKTLLDGYRNSVEDLQFSVFNSQGKEF